MKPATAPSPSRQETSQPKATREPESRGPESNVRPIDKASDSKLNTSSSPSTPKSQATVNQAPNEEHIRQRAYELYVESGYSDGNDEEHWFAAERELRGKGK
jgi:Protein of unknown function (DUF2934)